MNVSGDDYLGLGELLELHASLRQALEARRSQIAQEQKQIGAVLRRIRELILSGKSTGDRIRDYVLVVCGHCSILEEKYRDLEASVADYEGQLALLKRADTIQAMGDRQLLPDYRRPVRVESLFLCVLSSGELLFNLSAGSCSLPSANYVEIKLSSSRGDLPVLGGNLAIPRIWGLVGENPEPFSVLDYPMQLRDWKIFGDDPPEIEIIIGDVKVRDWFYDRGSTYVTLLERAAEALGHSVPPTEEELAQLELNRSVWRGRLEELSEERDRLWQEIKGLGREVSEDLRRSLAKIEEELERVLEHAKDLGLKDLEEFD